MSGGSYDYAYSKIEDLAREVRRRANDPNYKRQGKALRQGFARLLDLVARAAYELEWADSGDTSWEQAEPHLRAVVSPQNVLAAALGIASCAREGLDEAIRMATEERMKHG